MSNYDTAKTIISTFSGQERYLTIPKVYIEIAGDLNTAVLLNQIVFWSDKTRRKDGFFYKTYKEWEEELMLTEYQVRRSANKLKDLGVIEVELKRANGSPILHYKLNMNNLSDSILKKLKNRNQSNFSNESEETSESLTVDDTLNDSVDDNIRPAKAECSPKKEAKHKHGDNENVLLTDDELEKLKERFPNDYKDKINNLSYYIASKGAKYKSHYMTILSWARRDEKENPRKQEVSEYENLF